MKMKLRSHPCPFNNIIGEAKKRCPRNTLGVLQTVVIAGLYSEKRNSNAKEKWSIRISTHVYILERQRKY
jgi:hypothetical protein